MKLDCQGEMKMESYYPLNSFRLCIDEMDENICRGRIFVPLSKEMLVFNDLTSMFLEVDKIYDYNNYPRSYQQKRTFASNVTKVNDEKVRAQYKVDEILEKEGNLITFDIVVTSRQHSNWQGIVKDKKGNIVFRYKSELELIDFITSCDL